MKSLVGFELFVTISKNVFINPLEICSIEQRLDRKGNTVVSVKVDGDSYDVEVPLDEFFNQFNEALAKRASLMGNQQYWAG